jgi:S-layer protein (TIGR01564 family)
LQSIAKLDTDIMDYQGNIVDTGAVNNYHLVLVGGPCVNVLAWKLVQDGKLDASYACGGSAWTPGTAYVIAVDNAFATGKVALLVAGATAADTKLATDVLSQGKIPATYTGSSAKITGTITSPTITPL